jgi:hypothetical protein
MRSDIAAPYNNRMTIATSATIKVLIAVHPSSRPAMRSVNEQG